MDLKLQKNLKFKIDGFELSVSVEEPVFRNASPPKALIKNLHFHPTYELFIIGDEPLTMHVEEDSSVYKNCIVCIPPFLRHKTIRHSGMRLLFSFDKRNANNDFSRFMNTAFSAQKPTVFKLSQEILFYASQLSPLFHSDTSLDNEIANSLMKLIFYNIFVSNCPLKKPASKNEILATNESYLSRIDSAINDFSSDMTLQNVADLLCFSTKHTSRIIKKNYKKTFSQLKCEKRLFVAAELLVQSDKTILEIVAYINFPSESYFYRKFKEFFSCTPLEYKKQHRSDKK